MVASNSAESKTSLAALTANQAMVEQTISDMKTQHDDLVSVVETKASIVLYLIYYRMILIM